MRLIAAISGAFPRNVRIDVNTLHLDDRTFSMEGVLYEGDLNSITNALKQITALGDITMKVDGQRFTYNGKVVGR